MRQINLGKRLSARQPERCVHYRAAAEAEPDSATVHSDLGYALACWKVRRGDRTLQEGVGNRSRLAEAHNNLGNALVHLGRNPEAIVEFQQALTLNPDFAEAHNNLGSSLCAAGLFEEAIAQYRQALRIRPDYDKARGNFWTMPWRRYKPRRWTDTERPWLPRGSVRPRCTAILQTS